MKLSLSEEQGARVAWIKYISAGVENPTFLDNFIVNLPREENILSGPEMKSISNTNLQSAVCQILLIPPLHLEYLKQKILNSSSTWSW